MITGILKKDITLITDYCFASKNWIDKINDVAVGKYDDWHELSDHCPIIIDFKE